MKHLFSKIERGMCVFAILVCCTCFVSAKQKEIGAAISNEYSKTEFLNCENDDFALHCMIRLEVLDLEMSPMITDRQINEFDNSSMYGKTPLMWAATKCRPDYVKFLIDKGALINLKDPWGYTALVYALENDCGAEIVKVFLEQGASPNIQTSESNLLAIAMNNRSRENYEIVKLLFQYGVDPNQLDKHGINLALSYLFTSSGDDGFRNINNINLLKLFVSYGVNLNVDVGFTSPISSVVRRYCEEIEKGEMEFDVIDYMVKNGAGKYFLGIVKEESDAFASARTNGCLQTCHYLKREAERIIAEQSYDISEETVMRLSRIDCDTPLHPGLPLRDSRKWWERLSSEIKNWRRN